MALGKYKDVYKLDDLIIRVDDIVNELSSIQDINMFNSMKDQLKIQIENLKKRERAIYAHLNLPKDKQNIEGINERLENYKQAVINLSGPRLQKEITGILDKELGEQFIKFQKAVDDIVNSEIIPRLGKELPDNFADAYITFLNQYNINNEVNKIDDTFKKAGRKFSEKRAIDELTRQVFVSEMTSSQRKKWEKIIGEKSGINSNKVSIETDGTTTNFNWLTETEHKTQTYAYSQPLDWRKKISDKIYEKLISLVPTNNQQAFSEVLTYLLKETEYTAFFVGESVNDIIGLCGEIQSIYYLYCFLGCDPKTLGNEIKWMGGKHIGDKNQKPHRDVLLQTFGIQVKNSISSELKSIDFADASVETILNKIDVSPEVKNLIANFYGTKYFNVGYNFNKITKLFYHDQQSPMNVKKDGINRAAIYKITYGELESKTKEIEKLLAFSAAALLYMDIGKLPGDLDANSLYLLGGATFYAASNILEVILKSFESNKNSRIISAFRIHESQSKDQKTIVEALNDNTRKPNYSEGVLKKIILTSSFNFKSLLQL